MSHRRDFLRALAILGGGLALPGRAAESGAPALTGPVLRLGVMPIHSVRTLVERFDPLRLSLEKLLGRPARIETAVDFPAYQRRTLAGEFDVVVIAIHMGRIAQLDAGWQPLVQLRPDHDALLITRKARPPVLPAALRGQQLAVIDQLAITVMAALDGLEKEGLKAGRDFRVVAHRTHTSAAQSVLSGLSVAAVTTSQGLHQMPDAVRDKITVQRHYADIPAFVIMARRGTPAAELETLRTGLTALAGTPLGADFLQRTGYTGIRPADDRIMQLGDPYLKATRQILGLTR